MAIDGKRADLILQEIDALIACAIGQFRRPLAVLFDQFREMGIDLILQEGGAGARASPSHVASINESDIVAFRGESLRNQGSGYTGSQDRDVAGNIGLQRRIVGENPVFDGPVGMIRAKIHVWENSNIPSLEELSTAIILFWGSLQFAMWFLLFAQIDIRWSWQNSFYFKRCHRGMVQAG
jgi:hypothetical protein